MLPFTKTMPKEMLPIGSKPLIQYAVEEAVASGIQEIVLVAPPGNTTIQEYFARNLSLESLLEKRGRHQEAESIRWLSRLADIRFAYQDQPLGLGHAVGCARQAVGDEPFALILPDALIVSSRPCVRQLIDCYELFPGSYVATREVEAGELGRFGILDLSPLHYPAMNGRLYRVRGMVEKPSVEAAPSRFGVFGRYLFEPEIFDYIGRVPPDASGEIQITNAMAMYCLDFPLYGACFEGDHYDSGNKLEFLQASVRIGLDDPERSGEFRKFLISVLSAQN